MMSEARRFRPQEICEHNTRGDCWIRLNGKVYDVSAFMERHPGGEAVIMKNAGKTDATGAFEAVGHSNHAKKMLKKFEIGIVADAEDRCSTAIDIKEDKDAPFMDRGNKQILRRRHGAQEVRGRCPFRSKGGDIARDEKKGGEASPEGRRSIGDTAEENIWMKDNGGRLVGKKGNHFGPARFGFHQAGHFCFPSELIDPYDDPKSHMNTRPYWYMREFNDEEHTSLRQFRFHMMKDHWLVLALCTSLWFGVFGFLEHDEQLHSNNEDEDGGWWSALAAVANVLTLAIVVGNLVSLLVFLPRALKTAHRIAPAFADFNSAAYALCHWIAMISIGWIGFKGNWLVARSAPVFLEAAFSFCTFTEALRIRNHGIRGKFARVTSSPFVS